MSVSTSTTSECMYVVQDLEFLAVNGRTSTIAKLLAAQDLNSLRSHRTKIAAALCALPDRGGLIVTADLLSGRPEDSPEAAFWSALWMHVHNEITAAALASR